MVVAQARKLGIVLISIRSRTPTTAMRRIQLARRVTLGVLAVVLVCIAYSAMRAVAPGMERTMPSWMAIVRELSRNAGFYTNHLTFSMVSALLGLLSGISLGFIAGCVAGLSESAYQMLAPPAVWLKATPVIALSPVLTYLLSGPRHVAVASACVICFFPVFQNVADGLRQPPDSISDYFASTNPSRLQQLVIIELPRASGFTIAGAKTASTLAVVGATVGEFMEASQGLGFLITHAFSRTDMLELVSTILLTGVLGISMYILVEAVARLLGDRFVSTGEK